MVFACRDDGGRTALHWCAELGLHDLLAALNNAAKAAANKLAEAAASEQDPAAPGTPPPPPAPVLGEMQDKQGDTALHVAARFDQGPAAQALLDMPSAAEACKLRNKSGWLPIHLAAFHGSSAVAKLLLAFDQGLATAKDRKGDSPAVLARRRGHAALADLLRGKGEAQGRAAGVVLVVGWTRTGCCCCRCSRGMCCGSARAALMPKACCACPPVTLNAHCAPPVCIVYWVETWLP